MGGRTFNTVIVLFWCATMTWLVVTKVLPPLQRGEPPALQSTFPRRDQLVCWRLTLDDRPIGWAASKTDRGEGAVLEVRSRVVVERMPLESMVPPMLGALLRQKLGDVDMDARSQITIDPFGKLSDLRTVVSVSEMENAVMLTGRVEGGRLRLQLRVAGAPYHIDPMPSNSLLSGEFLPQTSFPDLHLGQTWTVPVFSPFRPNSPLEILQASVEGEEFIRWNGEAVPTWTVVYRRDAGSGISSAGKPRAKVWVRRDGFVLQQEVSLLNAGLRFVRMSSADASKYLDELNDDWQAKLRVPATMQEWPDGIEEELAPEDE